MYILRGCGRRVTVGACIQDVKCVHNREGGVGCMSWYVGCETVVTLLMG